MQKCNVCDLSLDENKLNKINFLNVPSPPWQNETRRGPLTPVGQMVKFSISLRGGDERLTWVQRVNIPKMGTLEIS